MWILGLKRPHTFIGLRNLWHSTEAELPRANNSISHRYMYVDVYHSLTS